MPYTLAKFLLWGILMAVAGGVVGWLLRSLRCRAEVARARSVTVDATEVERLRGRVANLEPVVVERDRLRMELADVRGMSAGALGFSTPTDTSIIPDDDPAASAGDAVTTPSGDDAASETTAGIDDGDTSGATPSEPADTDDVSDASGADTAPSPAPAPAADVDVDAAAAVLGKKIRADDLTVVEGIGPKIAELCRGIGITTWNGLATAEVAELQSMLDAAGSRFQMHKPASWPQQASLLAAGRWDEFKELIESLSAGR